MHPLTIDSFELARSGRQITGELAIATLPRLVELLSAPDRILHYRISGLINDDGSPGARLHLTGTLQLVCQRCNEPLDFELDRAVEFRFVGSEEELNALPIDDDEVDAVVGSRTMNVHDWIEDEAMLSCRWCRATMNVRRRWVRPPQRRWLRGQIHLPSCQLFAVG